MSHPYYCRWPLQIVFKVSGGPFFPSLSPAHNDMWTRAERVSLRQQRCCNSHKKSLLSFVAFFFFFFLELSSLNPLDTCRINHPPLQMCLLHSYKDPAGYILINAHALIGASKYSFWSLSEWHSPAHRRWFDQMPDSRLDLTLRLRLQHFKLEVLWWIEIWSWWTVNSYDSVFLGAHTLLRY